MSAHRETGIRLPKALREELGLGEGFAFPISRARLVCLRIVADSETDDRGAQRNGNRGGRGAGGRGGRGGRGGGPVGDRKAVRKQTRWEKRTRSHPNQKRGRPQYGGGTGEDDGDGHDVDPFDISDPSDIEELMKPLKERKAEKAEPQPKPPTKGKKSTSKVDEPEPREGKKEKKEKKTAKRKAMDDLGDESAPQKKRPSKAVLDRIAQDEAEIAFLEKKLKIKSKKVPKAFEEDGLDFLLDGLKDDYLDDPQEPVKNKRKVKVEVPVEEEEEESHDEDGEMEDMSDGGGLGDGDGGSDGEDDFEGFSDSGPSETEEAPPKVRENPYKPGVTTLAATDEKPTAKYIPPSLRKPASSELERLTRLRRHIQGLINRLSEAKLIPILSDFEELYRANPRADVTTILTDILVATLCDPSALNDTYHVLHGGFLAALYRILGTDVGATVVQRIVEEFLSQHERVNGTVGPSTAGKECSNLISFLSELYNFQVIGCVLIFDFIRMFLSELTELHTELLLKVVRNSGPQLRSDDPTALKSLVALLQPAIAKAGGIENLSVRTKFMIETLTNLKNNRLKSSTAASVVTAEHTVRMKKHLGSLNNTRTLRATEALRASLDDIRSTETKGKWWLVGASWAGGAPTMPSHEEGGKEEAIAPYVSDSEEDSAGVLDLQALARQHRMNTDIRRAIFITLLSSTDFADAHTKLLKLRLKRSQEREIPRVLLHCAAAEGTYNPYYSLVAKKLCTGHALRMTFTFTLWDYFRRFGEDDGSSTATSADDDIDDDDAWSQPAGLRKIVNLARLYASLITSGSLQLTILKTLNWAYLQSPTKSFLEVFFTTVLAESEWELNVVFSNVSDNVDLARGALHFIKKRMKHGGVAAGEEEKAAVKRGVKSAVGMLEDVLKAQIVG